MPSRTKLTLSVLIFLLAVIAVAGLSVGLSHHAPIVNSSPTSSLATTSQVAPPQIPTATAPVAGAPASANDEPLPPEPSNFIHATLTVASTSYTLAIPPGNSLVEGMQLLVNQTVKLSHPFTFTEKDYPGMGELIESINGISNNSTDDWFVYVNGKESTTGASNIIIHSGDVISWRYESASSL